MTRVFLYARRDFLNVAGLVMVLASLTACSIAKVIVTVPEPGTISTSTSTPKPTLVTTNTPVPVSVATPLAKETPVPTETTPGVTEYKDKTGFVIRIESDEFVTKDGRKGKFFLNPEKVGEWYPQFVENYIKAQYAYENGAAPSPAKVEELKKRVLAGEMPLRLTQRDTTLIQEKNQVFHGDTNMMIKELRTYDMSISNRIRFSDKKANFGIVTLRILSPESYWKLVAKDTDPGCVGDKNRLPEYFEEDVAADPWRSPCTPPFSFVNIPDSPNASSEAAMPFYFTYDPEGGVAIVVGSAATERTRLRGEVWKLGIGEYDKNGVFVAVDEAGARLSQQLDYYRRLLQEISENPETTGDGEVVSLYLAYILIDAEFEPRSDLLTFK